MSIKALKETVIWYAYTWFSIVCVHCDKNKKCVCFFLVKNILAAALKLKDDLQKLSGRLSNPSNGNRWAGIW